MLWDTRCRGDRGEAKPAPLVTGRARCATSRRGARRELKIDGVFVAIGHSPNTELFKGKLAMDSEGYLITKPDSTATDIDGVFAAATCRTRSSARP